MSLRVFIVDDDRDHAESIADVLTLRGFETELAFSGEAGLARFREAEFDIVFMDVKLPGMNGVETFFEFRKLQPDVKVMHDDRLLARSSWWRKRSRTAPSASCASLSQIKDLLDVLDQVKPRGMVLVADDDPEFAASLEPILLQHGYRCEIVTSGDAAFEKASCVERGQLPHPRPQDADAVRPRGLFEIEGCRAHLSPPSSSRATPANATSRSRA